MLEKFERYPLTFGPTHIEKLERLSQHLGGQVELYAKREDCNSGLAFGGNKLRKLEYIIPDAIASNADTLVSIGGVQSNHTRMVAAVAAKIGMKCRLVQESWVPHEDAVYDRVGNILLSRIMGADVQTGRRRFRHRHSPKLGRGDRGREGQGRQALCDPGRRLRAQIWRARLCRLRRGGAGAGEGARLRVRLHRGLHRHRLDPCRHAGGICQGRPRAQGDRHRCFLHPGPDQGPGARHRPQHRRPR